MKAASSPKLGTALIAGALSGVGLAFAKKLARRGHLRGTYRCFVTGSRIQTFSRRRLFNFQTMKTKTAPKNRTKSAAAKKSTSKTSVKARSRGDAPVARKASERSPKTENL